MYYSNQPKAKNIFTALVREKTPGAILEFSFWCTVCVMIVMGLVASIVGHGKVTWILMMVFSIGMAVMMAFRLKPLTMLYGAGVFQFLTVLIHFLVSKSAISANISTALIYEEEISFSAINWVLFVLVLLTSIALVACGFVHFFSRIQLGTVMTILSIAATSLTIILQILLYAVPAMGADVSDCDVTSNCRFSLVYGGYWYGTVTLWILLILLTLLYAFFFWGCIDSSKDTIINVNGQMVPQQQQSMGMSPAIVGIRGALAGQTFYLKGGIITIGSGQNTMLSLPDPYVSGQHCAIRFNAQSGMYEVFDDSTNGTFVNAGTRLNRGRYNAVPRGSMLYVGSQGQQFQLI